MSGLGKEREGMRKGGEKCQGIIFLLHQRKDQRNCVCVCVCVHLLVVSFGFVVFLGDFF